MIAHLSLQEAVEMIPLLLQTIAILCCLSLLYKHSKRLDELEREDEEDEG